MLRKSDTASFTYCWGMDFFLETDKGNFVWKDPEYGGDNTISPFNGDLNTFLQTVGVDFGRDKGLHTIEGYCGPDVVIVEKAP